MILVLELPNFFQLLLLFHFQRGLVDCLAQQHVENRLYFLVIVEEIVVFDLSYFVDACFLRNVAFFFWLRLESVGLQFHFCFLWL